MKNEKEKMKKKMKMKMKMKMKKQPDLSRNDRSQIGRFY